VSRTPAQTIEQLGLAPPEPTSDRKAMQAFDPQHWQQYPLIMSGAVVASVLALAILARLWPFDRGR
jgi:hypothetical protein